VTSASGTKRTCNAANPRVRLAAHNRRSPPDPDPGGFLSVREAQTQVWWMWRLASLVDVAHTRMMKFPDDAYG
jgi:hypothetical protein